MLRFSQVAKAVLSPLPSVEKTSVVHGSDGTKVVWPNGSFRFIKTFDVHGTFVHGFFKIKPLLYESLLTLLSNSIFIDFYHF